jgi:hypothetical protein
MKIVVFLLVVSAFVGCNTGKQRRPFQGYFVESDWVLDTVPHGKTVFYRSDSTVAAIENYNLGVRTGLAIRYSPDGYVTDSFYYKNGYEDGFHSKFDSSGKPVQRLFMVRGFAVGPKLTYRSGRLIAFEFLNFEQQAPYYMHFADSVREYGRPYFFNTYPVEMTDGTEGIGVFGYIVHPPEVLDCSFSLVAQTEGAKSFETIRHYRQDEVIIDTVVSRIAKGRMFFQVIMKDRLRDTSSVRMIALD